MEKYTVKKGDTLTLIALQFNTTVSAIKSANSTLIKDVNKIEVGWVLNIPTKNDDTDIAKALNKCIDDIGKLDSYKELEKLLS